MSHCDGARNQEVYRCLFISRIETLSHTTFRQRTDNYSVMGPIVCSLLAVSVIGTITLLVPVRSQRTTKYCVDDDSDRSVLTAMVARLQDTVERQQQSLEQQHQANQHSMDELYTQYRELLQVLNTSTENQLQKQRQLKELTKLKETLAKYENCMYMSSFIYYCFCKSN